MVLNEEDGNKEHDHIVLTVFVLVFISKMGTDSYLNVSEITLF